MAIVETSCALWKKSAQQAKQYYKRQKGLELWKTGDANCYLNKAPAIATERLSK